MPPSTSTFAAESGHWYRQDGTPCYEVPNKSARKKCPSCGGSMKGAAAKAITLACTTCDDEGYIYPEMRQTTLTDARKLKLAPSTTGAIRAMAAPGLVIWEKQQIKDAIYTAPKAELEGLSPEAWNAKVDEWANAHKRQSAAVGTDIHATLEVGIRGGSLEGYQYAAWYYAAEAELRRHGVVPPYDAERSFTSRYGYGCKVDLIGPGLLIDFKTKDFKDDENGMAIIPDLMDEHLMQVAANAVAGDVSFIDGRFGILFVDRQKPRCALRWASTEGIYRGWEMFKCCLRLTQLRDEYVPEWAEVLP